jgi:hypothetical protein
MRLALNVGPSLIPRRKTNAESKRRPPKGSSQLDLTCASNGTGPRFVCLPAGSGLDLNSRAPSEPRLDACTEKPAPRRAVALGSLARDGIELRPILPKYKNAIGAIGSSPYDSFRIV